MDRIQQVQGILSILKTPAHPVDSFRQPNLAGSDVVRAPIFADAL